MTFKEKTNGLGDELKESDVESGGRKVTNETKIVDVAPDVATRPENDASKAEKDDDPKTINAKENGIQWLPKNPKILIYPEGIPEKRGRQQVEEMFKCHAEKEDNWDYQDALKKFREMYPRAATGDPRDPWRKKDAKPCSARSQNGT